MKTTRRGILFGVLAAPFAKLAAAVLPKKPESAEIATPVLSTVRRPDGGLAMVSLDGWKTVVVEVEKGQHVSAGDWVTIGSSGRIRPARGNDVPIGRTTPCTIPFADPWNPLIVTARNDSPATDYV